MVGLFILLLAGASFAAAIVSVLAATSGRGWARPPPRGAAAQQILDERLARSQIDVGDYLLRKAALRSEWVNGMEYHPSDPSDGPPWEPPPGAGPPPAPHRKRRTPIMDDRPLIHVMPGLVDYPLP